MLGISSGGLFRAAPVILEVGGSENVKLFVTGSMVGSIESSKARTP